MRISVIGTSGSGKTTLARRAAQRLGVRHVELDALHWGPDWTERPRELFRRELEAAVAQEAWVMCGNYRSTQPLILSRAQVLVWLDYPQWLVTWRVAWRSLRRSLTGEPLWAGNRESLRKSFFSRDSVILWSLTTHGSKKQRYSALFNDPAMTHIHRVRLRNPRQAERWLRSLGVPRDKPAVAV